MPDLNLSELKAIVAGTSAAPWHASSKKNDAGGLSWYIGEWPLPLAEVYDARGLSAGYRGDGRESEANARFIAAARTALPDLISALEQERAENARLREALGPFSVFAEELSFRGYDPSLVVAVLNYRKEHPTWQYAVLLAGALFDARAALSPTTPEA